MNSYWYLFESELHSDTCKEISNQWNDLEAHKGKVGDGDPKLDNYILNESMDLICNYCNNEIDDICLTKNGYISTNI